eukprot:GILI01013188.1.p1 GENE.GILI01013188.1~~GILI01013188.1.p1  ORF type:complete len:134 (-),score=4.61 GILI01013188.1:155-556(-)
MREEDSEKRRRKQNSNQRAFKVTMSHMQPSRLQNETNLYETYIRRSVSIYEEEVVSKALITRFSKSDLIWSEIIALPLGVISATSSSTVIFSKPLLLITSLQYCLRPSLQPLSISSWRRYSLSFSFSPDSTSL